MRVNRILVSLLPVFVLLAPATSRGEEQSLPVVEDGRQVSIEYTMSLPDGTDIAKEKALTYEQGQDEIFPKLEEALEGLRVNDTKTVTLAPDEAYGAIDPARIKEVEAGVIPEQSRKEGAALIAEDEEGVQQLVRVREVRDETVVIDFNHPLAGKTLKVDVRVVGIE